MRGDVCDIVFVKENVNPKNRVVSDCVVRAIVKYLEQPWESVYKELCAIGLEKHAMPNEKTVYEEYFKRQGLSYVSCSKIKKGSKRPRVTELAKKEHGIFIVANHLTVSNGTSFFDTWDCGDHCVYGYWQKVD